MKEIIQSALGGLSYGKTLAIAASVAILTVGGFAALSQLQIASAIINGLFYGILAIVVGSAVIAIGGGGIQPMQQRWQSALQKWDQEKPQMQQQMNGAGERIQERTSELKEMAQSQPTNGASAGARPGSGR